MEKTQGASAIGSEEYAGFWVRFIAACIDLLFYAPIGQFWFLYALMIWQVIALVCSRFKPALVIVAIALFCLSPLVSAPFFSTAMKMGVFFACGAVIGPRFEKWSAKISTPQTFTVCCCGFFLAIYAIWSVAPVYSWRAIPAAVFGIGLTSILCYWANRSPLSRPLRICGERSMHIYVMHIMAAAGVRISMIKAGIGNPTVLLLFGTAAGVLLPLGASQVWVKAKRASKGRLAWLSTTIRAHHVDWR